MKCRVWAPRARQVELVFANGERGRMQASERGYFEIDHPRFGHGARYAFSLEGGSPLPDPRSRSQPDGVHAASEWLDLERFSWSDDGFRQAPLTRALVYELHVGTFTSEGSFEAVLTRLDHLRRLGVTHVELMPVAAFPGRRGWGYDGVDLFAPHAAYGGPEAMMRLVNECHRQGLAVILDVVYNHLGPSGNYLGQFGPYFSDRYRTPWGEAVNYDGPGSDEVRRFVCDNALHWFRHYHVDGLRLDAIHAIFDQSATHILEQLAAETDALAAELDKPLILVGESHLNDPRYVRSRERGGIGLSSQWSDDLHHALRTVLTGEHDGYYEDFGRLAQLAEALRRGFVYKGEYSRHRQHSYGRDSHELSGRHFHVFSQNHDQIGNRATGDRLGRSIDRAGLQIAAALVLLSPYVPMLFMGEEWGASTPFQYFTDHREPELAEAVRSGRKREFQAFGWNPEQIPDPQAESTFVASKLDWSELETAAGRELFEWYLALLALRRREPDLAGDSLEDVSVEFDEDERWLVLRRGRILVMVNFSEAPRRLSIARITGAASSLRLLLASHAELQVTESHASLPCMSVGVAVKER